MGRSPLVTLGMPVRNGQHVIEEALDSVLAQTVADFELVIADNASTDHTEAICREYARRDARVRYHRHERNLGAARNFNFTFAQCRSAYFKWMAHDDVIAPTYLERCLSCFEQGPTSLVLCYPQRQLMSYEGRLIPRDASRPSSRHVKGGAFVHGHANGTSRDFVWGPSFRELLQRSTDECPMFVYGLMWADALRRTRGMGAYPSANLVLVAELRLLGNFAEVPETLYYQRLHRLDKEWLARASIHGQAQWYDPDASVHRARSRWMLFSEHMRGIATRPVPMIDKARAFLAMTSYFPVRLRRLIRSRALMQRLKEQLTPYADPRLY